MEHSGQGDKGLKFSGKQGKSSLKSVWLHGKLHDVPRTVLRDTGQQSTGTSELASAQGSDAKGRTPSHPRPGEHSACTKYNAAATRKRPMMMRRTPPAAVCAASCGLDYR